MEQKDLKTLQFDQVKKSCCKIGIKEDMITEEMSVIEKKASILHQENRKDSFKISRELLTPYPCISGLMR